MMPLETELPDCVLRPWRLDEKETLFHLVRDPSILDWMFDEFWTPSDTLDAHKWIRNNDNPSNLAIIVGGQPIGHVGLQFPPGSSQQHTASLFYWVGAGYRRRRYATAAVGAVVPYAFENDPTIVRMEAAVFAGNVASIKILERTGFVMEGDLEKAVFKNGRLLDLLVFAKLRARGLTTG